jgi:hypothetical protein
MSSSTGSRLQIGSQAPPILDVPTLTLVRPSTCAPQRSNTVHVDAIALDAPRVLRRRLTQSTLDEPHSSFDTFSPDRYVETATSEC